jgi:hypothetical protein
MPEAKPIKITSAKDFFNRVMEAGEGLSSAGIPSPVMGMASELKAVKPIYEPSLRFIRGKAAKLLKALASPSGTGPGISSGPNIGSYAGDMALSPSFKKAATAKYMGEIGPIESKMKGIMSKFGDDLKRALGE